MELEKSKQLLLKLAALYIALAAIIFFAAGDGFKYEKVNGDMLSPTAVIGELTDGITVEQRMQINADRVEAVNLQVATFARANTGIMEVRIIGENGEVLGFQQADIADMTDGRVIQLMLPGGITGHKGEYVTLQLRSQGCGLGNAVTVYYGNSVNTGRFDIAQQIDESDFYRIDGVKGPGKLCANLSGVNHLHFYKLYWPGVLCLFAILCLLCAFWWRQGKQGISNPLTVLCEIVIRYEFLTRQLVARDFKAKYKRSVLGVFWSFLNPLLTMSVQYLVFSTLFKSNTPYFATYLLTGLVIFGFFNEACSLGMSSITGNAALIKKVYIPKYIFPVSRVLSSLVNFLLGCIPLLGVMLLSGLAIRPALGLLVFDVLCLTLFVIGMVLLLSTMMTFFQDTQFLWSVFSMIWMYLTPIFYPESIIPGKFITLYRLNPMYQFITFARTCIIGGVSPSPYAYAWCLLPAIAFFAAGVLVFHKYQDDMVLRL